MTHWDRVSYPSKSIVYQNEHFDQRSKRPKEDIKGKNTLNGHEDPNFNMEFDPPIEIESN